MGFNHSSWDNPYTFFNVLCTILYGINLYVNRSSFKCCYRSQFSVSMYFDLQKRDIEMSQVILKPTTPRLKRLIEDYGETWRFIKEMPMQCFNGDIGVNIISFDGYMCNIRKSDME